LSADATATLPPTIPRVPGEFPGERIRLPPRARVEPLLKSMVPLPLRVWVEVPPPRVVVPGASFKVEPLVPEVPTSSFVTLFRADVPPKVTVEELPIDRRGVDMLVDVSVRNRLPEATLTEVVVASEPDTLSVPPPEMETVPPDSDGIVVVLPDPLIVKLAEPPTIEPIVPPVKLKELIALVEAKLNVSELLNDTLEAKLKSEYFNVPEPKSTAPEPRVSFETS